MRPGIIVPSRNIILPRYRDSDYDRYVPQRPAFKYPLIRQAAVVLSSHTSAFSNANVATVAVTIPATSTGDLIIVGACNSNNHLVTGVTDNLSPTPQNYSQATGCASVNATNGQRSDIWYFLSSGSGVTSVTATYDTADVAEKTIFVHVVSGMTGTAFDAGNGVSNGTSGAGTDCTGATVTTSTTTGYAFGVIAVGVNGIGTNPKTGNEFNAGGDINPTTLDAACGLIYSTATTHTPVWTSLGVAELFAASTAAFKGTASGGDILNAQACL